MNQHVKKISSIWLACCLLLTLLPVSARAEDGSAAVEQIALDRATLTLAGGGTETLYASIAPDEAAGSTITWTSSSSAVVTVSNNGEVTAVGPGTAVITASAGGKSATCVVTVSGVVLSPSTLDLLVSNSAALGKATYGNAVSVSQWLWKSSDSSIAWVSAAGLVTGVAVGTATITCYSSNSTFSADCVVTVAPNAAKPINAELDGGTLALCGLRSQLNENCRDLLSSSLSYVTNLAVPTAEGTLYYGYRSESDPGAGVASSQKYYDSTGAADSLSNITFVPKSGFSGTATISYTGWSVSGQSYVGEIAVTVDEIQKLTYTSQNGEAIHFSADDFSAYSQTLSGRAVRYVTFELPAARYGTLYYNYTGSDLYENEVNEQQRYYRTTDPALDQVAFVPAKGYTGTFTLYYSGCDTAGNVYDGELLITVSRNASSSSAISYTGYSGKRLYFDPSDVSDVSYDATGYQLSYVQFTLPSSARGILYYNGSTKVTSGTSYYRTGSSRLLEDVSFIPDEDFTGTVSIAYTGYDTKGTSFSGTIQVKVTGSASAGSTISYTGVSGKQLYFDTSDFSDASYDETGYQLNYVRFTLPSASRGVLYYDDSTKVTSGTSYYRTGSSRLLEDVSFIPDKDFTGTVSIAYTGYDTKGTSFSGTIQVKVTGRASSGSAISYTGSPGKRLYFQTSDFSDASYDETRYQLNYVRFTLPFSTRGVLYYDDSTKVTSGTSYYRTGSSRLLEDVSFIPDKDFTGTVSIGYTGYDTKGTSFSGTIRVTVSDSGSSGSKISYTGYSGQRLYFNTADFSDTSYDETGYQLNYVRFTLPSSTRGVLYYDDSTKVTSGTSYYRTGSSRLLEDVSFIPDKDFTGTVSIGYTGYDTKGTSFSGTITVLVNAARVSNVSYSTSGQAVLFQTADFSAACSQSLSGALYRVQIAAPDASAGRLCCNFTAPNHYEAFDAQKFYYLSGTPSLSSLSFVPKAGYSGSVYLSFSGEDRNGNSCTNTVRIQVTPAGTSTYFSDLSGQKWAIPAVDFLYRYGIVSGTGAGAYTPSAGIRRGDFVLMLSRAFNLSAQGGTGFSDVVQSSYYASDVMAAKALGIVSGDANGLFHPEAVITRQEAAVILYRCMQRENLASAGTQGDLALFSDRGQVSSYAVEAVGALVRLDILSGDDAGNLNPKVSLTRAQMAVMLYRALTL